MNLSLIKSSAEAAKFDQIALDFWREDISPEDVLRLVEVARAAIRLELSRNPADFQELANAVRGIEP